MALNFPDSPTVGQVYTDTVSGFSYEWDGTVWQSYSAAASSNISILDDISGSFNGSTDTFALSISGTSFIPANAQQLRVVLGGVVQEPLTDYTVSSSNIIFSTPPAGALDCSIISLGPAVPINVPGDGTVTPVKLSTGGPSWNTSGDVSVSGISTLVGFATFQNDVYVAGVVTATSAIVGSAVTINSTGVYTIAGIVTAFDFDTLSDINYKENIETVNNALDIVSELRGVKFDWKETKQPSYGVIAQELENILPEIVHGENPRVVNYNGIIGVLIEAIKELKNEIQDLKSINKK